MSRLLTPRGEPEWHRQFRVALDRALKPGAVVAYSGSVPDNANVLLVSASAAAVTVALPPVAQSLNRTLRIKKTDSSANAVTMDANASETIDGALTKSLTAQWQAVSIICDGTAWYVL